MDLRLLPFIINSFDNEAKRRTDGVDILSHNAFHNRGFASIVKAATQVC